MKEISIDMFLTEAEIKKVFKLKKAKLIKEQIIEPNLDRINKAIGQKNDAGYLGYLCEYVVTKTQGDV